MATYSNVPVSNIPAIPNRDLGQTMGIISIIAAFIFPIVGIPLGIISRRRSHESGHPGTLGLIGLVISAIATVPFILSILALLTWLFGQGVVTDTVTTF